MSTDTHAPTLAAGTSAALSTQGVPLTPDQATPQRKTSGPGRLIVRVLELLLVGCLLTMIVMVFGNVVLRYGFDSGLVLSEELSRFAFVWMTFVGAILAAREGLHVGVDTVLVALPDWAQRLCLVVAESLVIACCLVFVWGTWRQHQVNATTYAAVSGLPLIWIFGVGYVTGAGIAYISLMRIVHILRGLPLERETAPEELA